MKKLLTVTAFIAAAITLNPTVASAADGYNPTAPSDTAWFNNATDCENARASDPRPTESSCTWNPGDRWLDWDYAFNTGGGGRDT